MTAEGTVDRVEERIGEAAATSRDEVANLGQTVQAEAKDVAQQAKTQAASAMRQMVDDARQQAEGQAGKLAETMRQAGEQMRTMADAGEEQSIATTLVREGASAADRLAGRLDDGGIEGALAEVRTFARRSPGAFLLGAAAAGFVTGRLVRELLGRSECADRGDAGPEFGGARPERGRSHGSDPVERRCRVTQLDATKPLDPDKSLGQLFGELSSEFTGLLQTQIELAKVELRSEAAQVGKTAGMFGGAAAAGYFAVLLLSFAAAWGLATVMNEGLAFLIVGVAYAIVAAVVYAQARIRAKSLDLVPKQTVASFKEDMQWARQKLS